MFARVSKVFNNKPVKPVYDNDPPKDGEGGKDGAGKPTAKTFTQEELNSFLAKEKKTWQAKEADLLKQLEGAKLTAQEKDALESRLEELRTSNMTEQEKLKDEASKAQKKWEKELKEAREHSDRTFKMYQDEKIERELTDAAIEHKAYRAPQVVALLRGKTRLTEELDPETKKPTGRLVTKVKFEGKDKEGKSITLDLTPSEAAKKMVEDPDNYGNLFEAGVKSGLGGQGGSSKQPGGLKGLSQAEINKLYLTNPAALGLEPR